MALRVTHRFHSPKTEQTDPTLVGPNEWNDDHIITGEVPPPTPTPVHLPFLVSSDYIFTPQTPGGTLNAGPGQVIAMNPLPPGVLVGDSLLISGGAGTSEAVPVTAVAGVNVTVTCSFAHSGAWTVQSATAGIQEALCILGTSGGGTVVIPPGVWGVYSTINVNTWNRIHICGMGVGAAMISAQFASGDLFHFTGTENVNGWNAQLSGITFIAPASNTLTFVHVTGYWYFYMDHCYLAGMATGFLADQNGPNLPGAIYIRENEFVGIAGGTCILIQSAQDIFIDHNIIVGGSTTFAGIQLRNVFAGIKISFNDVFGMTNGLLMNPASGQLVVGVESTSNYYDTCGTCVNINPAAGGQINHLKMLEDWCCGATANNGIAFIGGGSIDDVDITQTIVAMNAREGIFVDNPNVTNARFVNLTIAGNSQSGAGATPGFVVLEAAKYLQISGGKYGPTASNPSNTQSFGIYLAPAASDFLDIHDVDCTGNLTGALAYGSTGTHNKIHDVRGYNPVGHSNIAVGASPFTYTAGASAEVVYVFGGGGLQVGCGGVPGGGGTLVATGNCTVYLAPGSIMGVIYTTIPNMVKDIS